MTNRQERTLAVSTFGRYGIFNVKVPTSSSVVAKNVLTAMGDQIKLKESSYRHFALYAGSLGQPKFKLDENCPISTIDGPLCLQRTGQDTSKEMKVLKTDDVAVHLLYSEALHFYQQDSSKFQPTPEQKQLLDEYSDPSFPTERQFLEVAQKVKGYTSLHITDCTLNTSVKHGESYLDAPSHVTCTCYIDGFQIQDTVNQIIMNWDWKVIKKWVQVSENKVEFELCMEQGNAGILRKLSLETHQAVLLMQGALETCTFLLHKLRPELKPSDTYSRERPDLKKEFINSIFGNSPRFSSLEPPKT